MGTSPPRALPGAERVCPETMKTDANPFYSVFHPTFTFCQCQDAAIMGDAAVTNPGPEGSVVHAFHFAEVYFLH